MDADLELEIHHFIQRRMRAETDRLYSNIESLASDIQRLYKDNASIRDRLARLEQIAHAPIAVHTNDPQPLQIGPLCDTHWHRVTAGVWVMEGPRHTTLPPYHYHSLDSRGTWKMITPTGAPPFLHYHDTVNVHAHPHTHG